MANHNVITQAGEPAHPPGISTMFRKPRNRSFTDCFCVEKGCDMFMKRKKSCPHGHSSASFLVNRERARVNVSRGNFLSGQFIFLSLRGAVLSRCNTFKLFFMRRTVLEFLPILHCFGWCKMKRKDHQKKSSHHLL